MVNSLVAAVNQNNSYETAGKNPIELDIQKGAGDIESGIVSGGYNDTYKGVASSAYTYTVTISGYSTTGQISKISIKPAAR
mgnify:FL=1